MKINLCNRYVGIALLTVIVIAGALFFYYDLPGQYIAREQAREDAITVINTQILTYNGTVSTITYQYGYWGSVDSTRLLFLDGKEFTFGSQLICQIGKEYTVTVEETTFRDNHVEARVVSINEKGQPK